tara:strand:+ start:252 stop:512 length:261 start_codon:yes stop_codon:yes gene_type:complete
MNFRIFVLISVPVLFLIAIVFDSKFFMGLGFLLVLSTIPFLVIEKKKKGVMVTSVNITSIAFHLTRRPEPPHRLCHAVDQRVGGEA